MKKAPKAASLKPFDFATSYKAPKSYLRTRVFQDGVGEQLVELLGEYFFLWATSIAFPELALPVIIQLKRWLKQARNKNTGNENVKLATQVILLVQKLEANGKFIEEKRAKVDFAPRDRTQVEAFLRDFDFAKTPLGAYVVGQRKARAERAKLLEEARREDDRKRRQDEKADLEDQVEDDSEGDEDEDEDEEMDGENGTADSDDEEDDEE